MPLANEYRPSEFKDMIGQEHLVGQNGILTKMGEKQEVQSMILYGPPGTGKTTAALILSKQAGLPLHKMNAVSASVTDIKKMIKDAEEPVILYLDEIQYFNKKQQQSLLPYIEDGSMTLIASTTENPYHDVYDAILSRCLVLEFHRVKPEEILNKLKTVTDDIKRLDDFDEQTLRGIANIASGDVRRAINTLELACNQYKKGTKVTFEHIETLLPTAVMAGFDKQGNSHYQFVSALQKSIRGSDPDASVFWLSKLLEGGDIISPSRRLLVIASEDIGLADKEALPHTLACIQAAQQLGLPEAYYPLTQAVIYLAIAPKSDSIGGAFGKAKQDIRNGLGATVPKHIDGERSPGYVLPHPYPNHWVNQQYMPDDLVGKQYYTPGDNQYEQNSAYIWWEIKNKQG